MIQTHQLFWLNTTLPSLLFTTKMYRPKNSWIHFWVSHLSESFNWTNINLTSLQLKADCFFFTANFSFSLFQNESFFVVWITFNNSGAKDSLRTKTNVLSFVFRHMIWYDQDEDKIVPYINDRLFQKCFFFPKK